MTRAGRPRDVEADGAIERALRALLSEIGYRETSIEKIAKRAGVAKATVYRRASDKAELVPGDNGQAQRIVQR